MKARAQDSPFRTLGFAALVAFGCALLVSSVVHYLRPIQQALASIDQARAIVTAANWHADVAGMSDLEIANAFRTFEPRLANLQAGTLIERVDAAPAEVDLATVEDRPEQMPVYLLFDSGRLARVVLPIRGRGMWSTIHGLLALEGDLVTIAGLVILEHGETPGIGDRIENPDWLAGWRGKRLYDAGGRYRLMVDPRPQPEDLPFSIDAITGATITVSAVESAVAEWLGESGYGPLLEKLAQETP